MTADRCIENPQIFDVDAERGMWQLLILLHSSEDASWRGRVRFATPSGEACKKIEVQFGAIQSSFLRQRTCLIDISTSCARDARPNSILLISQRVKQSHIIFFYLAYLLPPRLDTSCSNILCITYHCFRVSWFVAFVLSPPYSCCRHYSLPYLFITTNFQISTTQHNYSSRTHLHRRNLVLIIRILSRSKVKLLCATVVA